MMTIKQIVLFHALLLTLCAEVGMVHADGQPSSGSPSEKPEIFDEPSIGILRIESFSPEMYQMIDDTRPRLGRLVFLTKEDDNRGTPNFELCDGKRVRVNAENLQKSSRKCDTKGFGTSLDYGAFRSGEQIPVFDSKSRLVGSAFGYARAEDGSYLLGIHIDAADHSVAINPERLVSLPVEGSGEEAVIKGSDQESTKWLLSGARATFTPDQTKNDSYGLRVYYDLGYGSRMHSYDTGAQEFQAGEITLKNGVKLKF